MNRPISENVLGVIPARFQSQRFPGKPLAILAGKTLLQRTYENAKNSGCFQHIVILTDDDRIYKHVLEFGGDVHMTPVSCPTGTDRIATFLKSTHAYDAYEIVVNVQGDEPCVSAHSFASAIKTLIDTPHAVAGTLVTSLKDKETAINRSVAKCVMDKHGRALYFSRSLIPGNKSDLNFKDFYYRHIGVYAYKRDFLLSFDKLEPTPLQLAEDLEQLKILEHGFVIATACVEEEAIGIDTPEDLHTLEKLLCTANISL